MFAPPIAGRNNIRVDWELTLLPWRGNMGTKRLDDNFLSVLDGFQLETLEREPSPVYGLSAEKTLNYLNPGWFVFASENGGEPGISERFGIGTFIGDALAGESWDYYMKAFQAILETGKVWHHDFECSSDTVLRLYHQSVYPLRGGGGLLVVNSLIREQPHEPDVRTARPPRRDLYVQETGLITQCSNCRRVQRVEPPDVWDWIPAWVRRVPPDTSHSFCPLCFDYYWRTRIGW